MSLGSPHPTLAPVDRYPGKACTLETSWRQVAGSPWERGLLAQQPKQDFVKHKGSWLWVAGVPEGVRELCPSCEWEATAVRACVNPVRGQMVRPGEGSMLPSQRTGPLS